MTPAPNCCSGSSPPPTNAAHWRSAPIGPSSNGAASCPSTPPPPASWTGCSTTPASSSPTVTPSACATPNTSEVSAPELTSNPAREWGLYLATSGDFNMATDIADALNPQDESSSSSSTSPNVSVLTSPQLHTLKVAPPGYCSR